MRERIENLLEEFVVERENEEDVGNLIHLIRNLFKSLSPQEKQEIRDEWRQDFDFQ